MQGLMYRLVELDADAAGLVRVIDYFDALVQQGSDLYALVSASATLAGCVAGVETRSGDGRLISVRADARGNWSPRPVGHPSAEKQILVAGEPVGTVWIERQGEPLPLDEMLVDRMALTAAATLHPRLPVADAEHVRRLLLSGDDIEVLSSHAALQVDPNLLVRVFVSAAPLEGIPEGSLPGRAVPISQDNEWLTLVLDAVSAGIMRGIAHQSDIGLVGVSLAGPASRSRELVESARFARQQSTRLSPIVTADDLGALVLLAPGISIGRDLVLDLQRSKTVREEQADVQLLDTLRVYLREGTLRAAAEAMYLHHSTVAHRLSRLTHLLGFAVDAIENRGRATAMMMMLDTV